MWRHVSGANDRRNDTIYCLPVLIVNTHARRSDWIVLC